MRIESEPRRRASYEELNQIAFTSSPYRWPTVGYTEDLQAMSLEPRRRSFTTSYYVPAQRGRLHRRRREVRRGRPDARARPSERSPPAPLPSRRCSPSRRSAATPLDVFFDASPRIYLRFRKPHAPARDDYVFDVIDDPARRGPHRPAPQAAGAQGSPRAGGRRIRRPGARLREPVRVVAIPLEGVKKEDVEKAIWEELEKLKTETVSRAGAAEGPQPDHRGSRPGARQQRGPGDRRSPLPGASTGTGATWPTTAKVINAIGADEISAGGEEVLRAGERGDRGSSSRGRNGGAK